MSEEKEQFEQLGLMIWNKDDLAQWIPFPLSL
jgi:hypothetical protein